MVRIWHKNTLGQTWTPLCLIKIHKDIFVLCTLCPNIRTLLYSYVQVQYLCFHNYFNLHTGSEVPDDFLSVTGSKLSASFSCHPLLLARACRKLFATGCKGEAAGFSCFSTVGAELNFTCSFRPFKK